MSHQSDESLVNTLDRLRPPGGSLTVHEILHVDGQPCLGRGWCHQRVDTRSVGVPVTRAIDEPDGPLVASFSEFVLREGTASWYTFLGKKGVVRGLARCTPPNPLSAAALRTLRRSLVDHVTRPLEALSPVTRPFYAILNQNGSFRSASCDAPPEWATPQLVDRFATAIDSMGDNSNIHMVVPGYLVELQTLYREGPEGVLALFTPVSTAPRPRLATLSPTQARVVRYAASGATAPEIARALGRSAGTVRTHLREAYKRLDVASRVELTESSDELALWGAR